MGKEVDIIFFPRVRKRGGSEENSGGWGGGRGGEVVDSAREERS